MTETEEERQDSGAAFAAWFKAWCEDRASRAELRRCDSVGEALTKSALYEAHAAMVGQDLPWVPKTLEGTAGRRFARALVVLANLRFHAHSKPGLGAQLWGDEPSERPSRVARARFEALGRVREQDHDTVIDAWRRVVRSFGATPLDAPRLFEAVYWWNDRAKETTALSYYSSRRKKVNA